jgi:hypothetical protein
MVGRLTRCVGVALGVLALTAPLALMATGASAAEFIADRAGQASGPFATRGGSGTAGKQEFALAPFRVQCAQAKSTGSVDNESGALADTLKFSHCTANVALSDGTQLSAPARFSGPLQLGYSARNGGATILAPSTIVIKSLGCTVTMEPGTLFDRFGSIGGPKEGAGGGEPVEPPFGALLTPTLNLHKFPTGEQEKLSIGNRQTGIHFAFGGACAAIEPAGPGIYSGQTFEEVVNGNLQYEPEGELEGEPGTWDKHEGLPGEELHP